MDVVAAVVKYNQQTLGRDKLCRIIQYGSRLTGYLLKEAGTPELWVKRVKTLDKQASTSRKLFRLGKSLDMIMAITRATSIQDGMLRVLIICRRLTYVIYYVIDHFTYAARLGLFKSDPKAWSKLQAKFWLAALVFGLLRNIRDLINLIMGGKEKDEDNEENKAGVIERVMKRPEVVLDTVKNSADFLLPFNVMGIIELNTGLVGVLGLISSLAGATPVWRPELKLKPS